MNYINAKTAIGVETVDEFANYAEAKRMVKEYNLSDSENYYYISSRSTKLWRDEKVVQNEHS